MENRGYVFVRCLLALLRMMLLSDVFYRVNLLQHGRLLGRPNQQ